MRKRKQYLWEVSRIGGSAAKFIGSVYAADENQALAAAIKAIENPPRRSMAAVGSAGVTAIQTFKCES
jgi:hypothetical protein